MTVEEKQKLDARLRLAQRTLGEAKRLQTEHENRLTATKSEFTALSYNFENQKKQIVGAIQALEGPSRTEAQIEVSVAQELVSAVENEIEAAKLKDELRSRGVAVS